MARKPDSPCILCGRLLWSRKGVSPAPDRRVCRDCRIDRGLPARGPLPEEFFESLTHTTNYSPARTMSAVLPAVLSPSKTNRMVTVTDPNLGPVTVWWDLDRPAMWRCGVHGRMPSPSCVHTQAAVSVLGPVLLGIAAMTLVVDPVPATQLEEDR